MHIIYTNVGEHLAIHMNDFTDQSLICLRWTHAKINLFNSTTMASVTKYIQSLLDFSTVSVSIKISALIFIEWKLGGWRRTVCFAVKVTFSTGIRRCRGRAGEIDKRKNIYLVQLTERWGCEYVLAASVNLWCQVSAENRREEAKMAGREAVKKEKVQRVGGCTVS